MMRAVTSASNIHRRALCAGSELLEVGLPEDESAQSREGSLLHAYSSNPKLDQAVLKPNQRDLLRIAGGIDDFVFKRVTEQFSILPAEPFEEWREEKLLFALHGTEYETPGHCDLGWYWPVRKLLAIVDWKYGFKIVTPAALNYQLRCYAIGGFEEWDVENCVVAINQPRAPYEERLTMAAYTRDDIEAAKVELISIRKACRDPKAPLHAGELQCRYCKAKTICSEFTKTLGSGLALVPDELGSDLSVAARESRIDERLSQLTVQQRDKLIGAIKFAGYIKDAVFEHERSVIHAGGESSYTLGKPSEISEIIDSKRAISLLQLKGDLTRDEILDCCEPKISELRNAVREKTKCTWAKAKEIVQATLESVLEKKERKPALLRK